MRELEGSLQQFGEFLLQDQLVRQSAAPHVVRWVRRILSRQASDEPLVDQVRRCCDDLERHGGVEDWQVRQAEQALRIYFVNFLARPDWHRRPASMVVDEQEFYQLLDKDGISEDIHLFNEKLREWENYCNYHRPHGALDGQTPDERLVAKMRAGVSPAS